MLLSSWCCQSSVDARALLQPLVPVVSCQRLLHSASPKGTAVRRSDSGVRRSLASADSRAQLSSAQLSSQAQPSESFAATRGACLRTSTPDSIAIHTTTPSTCSQRMMVDGSDTLSIDHRATLHSSLHAGLSAAAAVCTGSSCPRLRFPSSPWPPSPLPIPACVDLLSAPAILVLFRFPRLQSPSVLFTVACGRLLCSCLGSFLHLSPHCRSPRRRARDRSSRGSHSPAYRRAEASAPRAAEAAHSRTRQLHRR